MNKPWLEHYHESTPVEIDPDRAPSIVSLFEAAVDSFPDHAAFECFGETKTFTEIEQQSRAVAAWLQTEQGVKRGDRVALMCPNTFCFPIAMLGILRAGATQVNVNPAYTPRELHHQLNDAGVETIIAFTGSTSALADIIDETPVTKVITVDLDDATDLSIPSPDVDERLREGSIQFSDVLRDGKNMTFERVSLNGADTAFFQYTGGTTGLSKGAVLTHRNLVANITQWQAVMPDACEHGKEIMVLALPLYHIFGLMLMMNYMSLGGKGLLIPNPRDMDGYINTLKKSKFSIMAGVNTLFTGMVKHPEFDEVDLSHYKLSVGGGAAVLAETSRLWKEKTGHHIHEAYGLSETSPLMCINPLHIDTFTETCGLPAPSTEILLLDDNNQEVPEGERGEICVRGPQVMRGYWNNEEANANAFTPGGFFKTGDIGIFVDGGFLKIVDRKKDMVIVSGFNVFPNEIEAVVTACEGVHECACIGVPSEKTGEALRVFATREEGSEVTAEDVVAFCRSELTGYKVPRQIIFVEELPKSNVGKILRRELRDMAVE